MQPRFSWKLRSDRENTVQSACRLTVSGGELLWDSGRVESAQSSLVEYLGATFAPRTAYRWEVTVWDNHGERAEASAIFETGLLSGAAFEGRAAWISHSLPAEETASPIFTKRFTVEKALRRARLYATALGVYEAELNGEKLDVTFFAPGWTNYHKRLQYQSYALSPAQGVNELRFTLGKGWYCGKLGFNPTPNNYGEKTALLALLILDYADGSSEYIGTDESWTVSTGAIRFSEIYDGETQDTAREEISHGAALRCERGFETLVGQENEPVRCLMRLMPEKSFVTPRGELVYDFGQNLTGWVEVKVTGRRGQTLTLHHAEALDENGNFYTGNLSFAKATDSYTLNGEAQTLRPHFTFHGFRYLWVEGLEAGQEAVFTACHLSTDLRQTGSFECSNALVNRLQQNIQWSQRDNYLDVPTDCPQRSERLGWTGDATAYSPTAAFNANILPFMRKWLRDLSSEQTKAIGMPQVVPNIMGVGQSGTAYWGNAATVLPWTLYRAYGDKRILAGQLESMKLWVDYITAQCGENGLWQSGFQYGDWLGLDAEMNALNEPRKGATEDYFAANACYLWSLQILADTAALLGEREEESRCRALREKVLAAFRE